MSGMQRKAAVPTDSRRYRQGMGSGCCGDAGSGRKFIMATLDPVVRIYRTDGSGQQAAGEPHAAVSGK